MKEIIDGYEKAAKEIENLPWGNGQMQDEAAYAICNEADKIRAGRGSKVSTARSLILVANKLDHNWTDTCVLNWLYLRKFPARK